MQWKELWFASEVTWVQPFWWLVLWCWVFFVFVSEKQLAHRRMTKCSEVTFVSSDALWIWKNATALTHSESDLVKQLRFCLTKGKVCSLKIGWLQEQTSGLGLIMYLAEACLSNMTGLFSCLPDAIRGLRVKRITLHILVLGSLENEKQQICVLLATVKCEHGLVPLNVQGLLSWNQHSLEVPRWAAGGCRVIREDSASPRSVKYSKMLSLTAIAEGLQCT